MTPKIAGIPPPTSTICVNMFNIPVPLSITSLNKSESIVVVDKV